jgi:hypothetical protein
MTDDDKRVERGQKIADTLRGLLTALATAGIGAAYSVNGQTTNRCLWLAAAFAFSASLAFVVRSWFVQKHKAIQRRKDPQNESGKNEFSKKWGWYASWLWDTLAAWALIVGGLILAVAIGRFPTA